MNIYSRPKYKTSFLLKYVVPLIFFCYTIVWFPKVAYAQSILQKKVSIQAKNKPVSIVLKDIEKQAGFYFSYNNNIIREDSLVSVNINKATVEQTLEQIFNKKYLFLERDNHLIIHTAPPSPDWYISGTIVDALTGEPVSYATVYERQHLISTMTDENGNFRLQLKEKKTETRINVSKVSYADTFAFINISAPQNTKISIQQISYPLNTVTISGVEQTWLAKRLLSTRQTMNSLNLHNFFARQHFQFSLTPGLGSHGRMGAQVVNKFSLNILGGYTAGVHGFEIGSLFNIVKQDTRYLQIAGVFNIVGGNMYGIQIGGLYNKVLLNAKGIQIAGLSNTLSGNSTGIQVSGLYNYTNHTEGIQVSGLGNTNAQSMIGIQIAGLWNHNRQSDGIQVAGLVNFNTEQTKGLQIAGLSNISRKTINGIQISGILNTTKKLKGLQIGLINISDSSEGYSIGLVNIAVNGYHKLSISTSELQHLTLSYKSGNAKLYSILLAGTQLDPNHKAFSIGYGLGSDRSLGKSFFLNPELSHQYFYTGLMASQNLLTRLQLHLKYKLGKKVALYVGPSCSIIYRKPLAPVAGYRSDFSPGYPSYTFGKRVRGWLGWSLGLDLF